MKLSEIETATRNDATPQRIISNIRDTNWQDVYDKIRTLPANVSRAELLHFHKIRQELTVTDSNPLLRDTRIVLLLRFVLKQSTLHTRATKAW